MKKLIYSALLILMISFISSCELHQEPFEDLNTTGQSGDTTEGGGDDDDGPE